MKTISKCIMKTKDVLLRPLHPQDYEKVYEMHTRMDNLHLWWNDRYILDFDSFINDLHHRLKSFIEVLFLIDRISDDDQVTIGLVYAYQANHIDKHVRICIYLLPEYTLKGYGATSGVLFCEYLFKVYGFRKIYAEILEYNMNSLRLAQKCGLNEEAVLSNYHWYDDRYWNLYIYSITHKDLLPQIKAVCSG